MMQEHESELIFQAGNLSAQLKADQAYLNKLRPMVVSVMSLLFLLSAAGVLLMLPTAKSGRVDFRTFYTAGYMVRTGHSAELLDYAQTRKFQNEVVSQADLALPFYHLAYESLAYVPLSYLGYRSAYYVFLLTNLMLLALSIYLLQPYFSPLKDLWSYLPLALVVCFLPVAMALIEGQDSLLLMALLVCSTVALDRKRELIAGVFVGLTLFKFQYALPIALLYLIWRRWRFLAGFALSGGVVVGLSGWILGAVGTVSYLRYLPGASSKFSSVNDTMLGIHPEGMANLRGFIYVVTGGSVLFANILTVVLSVFVLWWAARRRASLPGALLATMLVSYHQMISDTSLLILPLGLVLAEGMLEGKDSRGKAKITFALIALLGPTILLFAGTRFYLLALPVLGLYVFWDGRFASPKDREKTGQCPQTETNTSSSLSAGA
jgi:hypothetical protein